MKKISLLCVLALTIIEAYPNSNTNKKFSAFYNYILSAEMPKDSNRVDLNNLEVNTILGLNFMKQGLDNSISDEYVAFKEKYGVGLINDGCVIDPFGMSNVIKNNKKVAAYLNKKYGKDWVNELSNKPVGL